MRAVMPHLAEARRTGLLRWLSGRRLTLVAATALVVFAVTNAVDRSRWVAPYLERVGADKIAAGVNGQGRDYAFNIWIPTHALERGLVPYDPADHTVEREYHANLPAGLYTPSILLFLYPLSTLSLPQAAEAMQILNILLIWLALLVLMPPTSVLRCAGVAALGLATLDGWAGANGLLYGQPIGFFVLGLALVAHAVMRDRWGPAVVIGLVLLLTKVQFALPPLVVLATLRRWRPIAASVLLTVVASLPFGVMFVEAAGGLGGALGVARRASAFAAANYIGAGRSDLLVLVTDAHANRWGTTGNLVELLFLSAAAAVAVGAARVRGATRAGAIVLLLVGVDLAAVYHEWYDLVAVVVPAAVFLARPRWAWRRLPVPFAVTMLVVLVDYFTRGSLRYPLAAHGAAGAAIVNRLDRWFPPAAALALTLAGGVGLLGRRRAAEEVAAA